MKPTDSAASPKRSRGRPRKPKAVETNHKAAAAPPVIAEVVTPPVAGPAPRPSDEASIATLELVNVNGIQGVGSLVPIEHVMGLLGRPALDRIAILRNSTAISDLSKRMIDTDGRCAPTYFTGASFFHGYEALAAAIDSGMSSVFVIVVPPDGATQLQQTLVAEAAELRGLPPKG